MIILILILNFLISILYLFKNRKEGIAAILIFIEFLIVPILGILMYYFPILIFQFMNHKNIYEIEDLILLKEDEIYEKRPNIEQETNIIPIKEALAINDARKKRQFILSIIKEDMETNYKTILPALQDSDSETSHYAAAMAMEIQRKGRKKINKIEVKLETEQENLKKENLKRENLKKENLKERNLKKEERKEEELKEGNFKIWNKLQIELLEALEEYIESGVLTAKDELLSKEKYIFILNKIPKKYIEIDYYLKMIEYLMDLENYSEALTKIREQLDKKPLDKLYEKMLEIYYITGNKEKFNQTIAEIRNSKVILSPESLQRLRFWMKKEG